MRRPVSRDPGLLYDDTRRRHGLSICQDCRDVDCRMEFNCERCAVWRGWCQGHSEGNECIVCEKGIRQKIIAFVKRAKWGFRRESHIRRHILGSWTSREIREPTMDEGRVDDMLYDLIQEEVLSWDPPKDEHSAGEEDMKYRFVPKKEVHEPTKRVDSVHVPSPRTVARARRKGRTKTGSARKQAATKSHREKLPAGTAHSGRRTDRALQRSGHGP